MVKRRERQWPPRVLYRRWASSGCRRPSISRRRRRQRRRSKCWDLPAHPRPKRCGFPLEARRSGIEIGRSSWESACCACAAETQHNVASSARQTFPLRMSTTRTSDQKDLEMRCPRSNWSTPNAQSIHYPSGDFAADVASTHSCRFAARILAVHRKSSLRSREPPQDTCEAGSMEERESKAIAPQWQATSKTRRSISGKGPLGESRAYAERNATSCGILRGRS